MSIAVVTGLSAAVGIVIARKLGRGVETDGFFAAYGVFLVLVLAASAVRAAVLPRLARARMLPRQGNLFAFLIEKPRLPSDLQPWMRIEEGELLPDADVVGRRYGTHA